MTGYLEKHVFQGGAFDTKVRRHNTVLDEGSSYQSQERPGARYLHPRTDMCYRFYSGHAIKPGEVGVVSRKNHTYIFHIPGNESCGVSMAITRP